MEEQDPRALTLDVYDTKQSLWNPDHGELELPADWEFLPAGDTFVTRRVKAAGHRIWFGSGNGIVRVRMYRSFQGMWQGWKKNLYRLMGGTPWAVVRETESSLPWIPLLLIGMGLKYPFLLFLGFLLLIARQTSYGLDLARNHFPFSFIFCYVPAVALYVAVLWASYRSHVNGRIQWKGREYSVGAAGIDEISEPS